MYQVIKDVWDALVVLSGRTEAIDKNERAGGRVCAVEWLNCGKLHKQVKVRCYNYGCIKVVVYTLCYYSFRHSTINDIYLHVWFKGGRTP